MFVIVATVSYPVTRLCVVTVLNKCNAVVTRNGSSDAVKLNVTSGLVPSSLHGRYIESMVSMGMNSLTRPCRMKAVLKAMPHR